MACFGSCGCEACCMSASELAEIASGVEIEIYAEDYPAYSPPIDTSSASMTSDGCCHVATWERNPGYSYKCRKINQLTVNESATISTKIVKTKTHVMNPPSTAINSNPNTFNDCTLINPPWEYLPTEGAADLCDDVYNCGTVTKNAQKLISIWGAVGYSRSIFKVAIHKLNLTCTEGQPAECKYVVEVAQGIDISLLGNRYESLQRSFTTTNIHQCCYAPNACYTTSSHSPEPTCEQAAIPTNGWSGGVTTRYWIVKYKVFDTLEDIPSEMVFDADDGWPCDKFTFCTYDGPIVSGDDLCFSFAGAIDTYEPGEIYAIAFMYNCAFCLDTGIQCEGVGSLQATNDPFFCLGALPGAGDNTCSDTPFTDRYDGRNYGFPGYSADGLSTVFYSVRGPVFMSTEGCFEVLPVEPGCKPDPDDRNECNFYDCPPCLSAASDGPLLPYQFKLHTVDAYSFNQTFGGFDVDSSPICIPFLRTKVTLIP